MRGRDSNQPAIRTDWCRGTSGRGWLEAVRLESAANFKETLEHNRQDFGACQDDSQGCERANGLHLALGFEGSSPVYGAPAVLHKR